MKVLAIFLGMLLFFFGCEKMPNQSDELTMDSEHLSLLSEMYPDVEFKLLKESEYELEYLADGKKISIVKTNDKLVIESQNIIVHANFNDSASTIKEVILKGSLSVSEPELISIEVYNKNYEMVGYKKFSGLSSEETQFANGCTSDNVLGCVENHCRDAGAILCGACALSKWCIGGVIAWCVVEVEFEIENPLHC